jgi:hypothetical protein
MDAIRLECWTGSDQNPGRHHLRTPGMLPLESAIWVLGGEVIRRLQMDSSLRRRPIQSSLIGSFSILLASSILCRRRASLSSIR